MFLLNTTIHSRADFQDDGMKFKNAVLKDFLKTQSLIKKKSTCLGINWKDPVSWY